MAKPRRLEENVKKVKRLPAVRLDPDRFLEILRNRILVRGKIVDENGSLKTTIIIYYLAYDNFETPTLRVMTYVNERSQEARKNHESVLGLLDEDKGWLTGNWQLALAEIVLNWEKEVPPWSRNDEVIIAKKTQGEFQEIPPSGIYLLQQVSSLIVRLAYLIEGSDLAKRDSFYRSALKDIFFRLSTFLEVQNKRIEETLG